MVNTTAQTLTLPTFSDADIGHTVSLSTSTLPSYITYVSTTRTFTIAPVATPDIG